MRPIWSDLEHAPDAARLWQRSRRRFTGNALGPHFEHVCRQWTRHFADEHILGDFPRRVCRGTGNDPANKTSHELDVVAFGLDDDDRQPILAIGEAKWGETMGIGHLNRLRHIRSLLAAQDRPGADTAKLACYSATGFTDEHRGAFRRFKDVLADRTGTLEPYFTFADARKHQRAAAWLADHGFVSTHVRAPRRNDAAFES
jgi:hypothetical protein